MDYIVQLENPDFNKALGNVELDLSDEYWVKLTREGVVWAMWPRHRVVAIFANESEDQ